MPSYFILWSNVLTVVYFTFIVVYAHQKLTEKLGESERT